MAEKILVVDDELDMLKVVVFRLKQSGYEVITASDGVEGLKKAEEEIPDLILLDVMMPRMDGYAMASKLRELKKTQSIPIIMLTAKSDPDDVTRFHELGAIDYIVKPFDQVVLLEKVKKHLPEKKRR